MRCCPEKNNRDCDSGVIWKFVSQGQRFSSLLSGVILREVRRGQRGTVEEKNKQETMSRHRAGLLALESRRLWKTPIKLSSSNSGAAAGGPACILVSPGELGSHHCLGCSPD